jgi:acyl-CoA ligase (AMP-forming) (exosortase A-associated)
MTELLHELLFRARDRAPQDYALEHGDQRYRYEDLVQAVTRAAAAMLECGLGRQERVAVFLPKQLETVQAMLGATAAGAVFVPVNPVLKPEQVAHILADCNVRILITSKLRAEELAPALAQCHDLHTLLLTDAAECAAPGHVTVRAWQAALAAAGSPAVHSVIDMDMAAILYTSGSTGRPKGVVLSHRNMVTGAHSVARYLENRASDRILAVLPFSFDYGFSQLSTAFVAGACCVLMDYLLPRDVLRAVERKAITGLAAVPPLWVQLAALPWPESVRGHLRYLTNSGGAMPGATLAALRRALPDTRVFLMYGLTEAFRSTYLPPEQVDRRPDSIGKAIPNAEILVVREDGSRCAPGEPGELVHRGSLVSLGYWNDKQKTAERFRPAPGQDGGLVLTELAVWSGDTVRMDDEGYLYFIGRRDEMIKTSGYRVSPTEIEEVVYATGLVAEAAAFGVPHAILGHAIVLAAVAKAEAADAGAALLDQLKARLPTFMQPAHVAWRESLPRNPNGKIDRKRLAQELAQLFESVRA